MYTNLSVYKNNFFKTYIFLYNKTIFLLKLNKNYSYEFKEKEFTYFGNFFMTVLRHDVFLIESDKKFKFLINKTEKKITLLNYSKNNNLPVVEYNYYE